MVKEKELIQLVKTLSPAMQKYKQGIKVELTLEEYYSVTEYIRLNVKGIGDLSLLKEHQLMALFSFVINKEE